MRDSLRQQPRARARRRVPESSVEILGQSAGGISYRHYAHRAPLAFKAIMTIPQPSAFLAFLGSLGQVARPKILHDGGFRVCVGIGVAPAAAGATSSNRSFPPLAFGCASCGA